MIMHVPLNEYIEYKRAYSTLGYTYIMSDISDPERVGYGWSFNINKIADSLPFEQLINICLTAYIKNFKNVLTNDDIKVIIHDSLEMVEEYLNHVNDSQNKESSQITFTEPSLLEFVTTACVSITIKYSELYGSFKIRDWTGTSTAIIYV